MASTPKAGTKAGTKPTTAKARNRGSKADAPGQWTEAELGAMKDHARELRDDRKRASAADKAAEGEKDVLAKIKDMPKADREMAERIHAIAREAAPSLESRTYYGMPAYARDGKVVAFFRPASKFKTRYGTLGFEDAAQLDDGEMWPASYALTKLTPAVEKEIAALIRKAAG